MQNKKLTFHLGFTLDSQDILCMIVKYHDKMFDAILFPKSLPKYSCMKVALVLDIMEPVPVY